MAQQKSADRIKPKSSRKGASTQGIEHPGGGEAVFTVQADTPVGTYDITVANPDGQSDTRANALTVVNEGSDDDDGCGCSTVRGPSSSQSLPAALLALAMGAI